MTNKNQSSFLELITNLLSGEVQPKILIDWIRNTSSEDETPSRLREKQRLRSEFVHLFLAYLREQTISQVQDAVRSGLTPQKGGGAPGRRKEITDVRDISSPRVKSTTSRSRLPFSSPVDEDETSPSSNAEKTPQRSNPEFSSPTSTNVGRFNRNKGKHGHFQDGHKVQWEQHKSNQKLSLGQFMLSPVSDNTQVSKKKSPVLRSRTDNSLSSTVDSPSQTASPWNKETSNSCALDLHDQDAFPPVGTVSDVPSRSQTSRRIMPTPVSLQKKCLPGVSPGLGTSSRRLELNNILFDTSSSECTPGNLQHERELLRQERTKMEKLISKQPEKECSSPSSDCLPKSSVQPRVHMEEIMNKDAVVILADVYAGLISANLVSNLAVELYFTLQLLTVSKKSTEVLDGYLCGPSNCVYFAVRVLWALRRLVILLDKKTLLLIADNPRVLTFFPELADFLREWTVQINIFSNPDNLICNTFDGDSGVAFHSDTDTRNNFVNNQDFHVFKKKRDLFYELLREWEINRLVHGWSMSSALGERIRALINFGCNSTINYHLARLFIAQLISMCKGDGFIDDDTCTEDPDVLSSLRKSNPEKYKRLKERFVVPLRLGMPCPPPSFTGCEEFFKEFIAISASYTFNQHLIDGFCTKIIELNAFQFNFPEDGESCNDGIDSDIRRQFLSCLLTLRLLAKFLGFIVFLPYQCDECVPENVQSQQMALRSVNRPVIDLLGCVEDSIRNHRTVLTVPWLVEFLSMMDPLASSVDYYTRVLRRLYQLLRSYVFNVDQSSISWNQFTIALLLGWLFEVVDCHNIFLSLENVECCGFSSLLGPVSEKVPSISTLEPLDSLALIDRHIMYICCPFLSEMKVLLVEFTKGAAGRGGNVRKITPVAADSDLFVPLTTRQLELKLEENFFRNQPVSLKRTVDFIVDRLSSNAIKNIRRPIVTEIRREASEEIRKLALSLNGMENEESWQKAKLAAAKEVSELAQITAENVKRESMKFAREYCQQKATLLVPLLFPEEMSSSVNSISVDIIRRLTTKKVVQWIAFHVTADVFHRDLRSELLKLMRTASAPTTVDDTCKAPQSWCAEFHDENVQAPSDALIVMKKMLQRFYRDEIPVPDSYEQICDALHSTADTLRKRQDFTMLAFRVLIQLTVDLFAALVFRHPDIIDENLQDIFLNIWNVHPVEAARTLESLYNRRSFELLLHSDHPEISWMKWRTIVIKALECRIISAKSFMEMCPKLDGKEWPEDFIGLFESHFEHIIDFCKRHK